MSVSYNLTTNLAEEILFEDRNLSIKFSEVFTIALLYRRELKRILNMELSSIFSPPDYSWINKDNVTSYFEAAKKEKNLDLFWKRLSNGKNIKPNIPEVEQTLKNLLEKLENSNAILEDCERLLNQVSLNSINLTISPNSKKTLSEQLIEDLKQYLHFVRYAKLKGGTVVYFI